MHESSDGVTNPNQQNPSSTKTSTKRRIAAAASTSVLALVLTVGLSASPAAAEGMKGVTGRITCNNLNLVGTSATAKGTVKFQLNSIGGVQMWADLGYSSAYAPWGFKWWVGSSREFYAYGRGTIGAVSSVSRYCQWALS